MKKLILLLFLPALSFAQDGESTTKKEQVSSYISDTNFKTIFNSHMSQAIVGDSDLSSLGSYVSLDVVKPKLSLAITKNWFSKNDYLVGATTLKFDGGINEGVATVFSDEQYNTNINLRLDQSFVFNFWGLSRFKYSIENKKLLDESILKIDKDKTDNSEYLKLLNNELDSLEKSKKTNTIEYHEIKAKVKELEKKDFETLKKDKELEAEWSSVRLVWLNMYAKYGTQKLYTYNPTLQMSDQLTKLTPENHEFGLSLNLFYDQDRDLDSSYKNSWVYLLNGQYALKYSYADTNNSNALTTDKIVTENTIGTQANSSRFIEETTNAYLFSSYDTFKRHQIAFDVNKKILENFYFHIYGDYNEIKDSDNYNGNYKNLGLGLIFGLNKKDKPKDKTIINFEVFAYFKDLEDKFEDSGDEFYKRATIGVRTTVPILKKL